MKRPAKPYLRQLARPQASLYNLPSDLQSSIQTALGVAWLLVVPFSALPILTGEAKERNEQRFARPNQDQGAEGVRWTVMGVLSFLPFLNWLAWVFAAFDDEDSATLYYTYAFLYALPYLANGLELDGFVWLSIAVGVAHVQVERIALTEPTEVELPEVLRGLLRAVPDALRGVGKYLVGLGSEAGERVQSAGEAARRKPDRKYLEEKSREARMELDEFDRKVREKERQQGRDRL
ncbi:hypothetical protein N2152v2_005900 [Parachlorella kessleri]